MTICNCCTQYKEGYCIYCPENDKNGNKERDDENGKEPKTICDDCIHADVCGEEDNFEPALKFCANKSLKLADIIPYLETGKWFTVVKRTGETCNKITYTYPERFKVVGINFEPSEQKICVIVDEVD